MKAEPITVLAFDYGEKRIGIAVGQTLTRTATALETVEALGARPDWGRIAVLIETWQPDALVVGVPLNMDGSEQPMTRSARRFGHQLHDRYELPVHTADERLSTREAIDRLAQAGRAKADNNPVAAQVILEGWLGARPVRP